MHTSSRDDNAVRGVAKNVPQKRTLFCDVDGQRQDSKNGIILQIGKKLIQSDAMEKSSPAKKCREFQERHRADPSGLMTPFSLAQNAHLIAGQFLRFGAPVKQNVGI